MVRLERVDYEKICPKCEDSFKVVRAVHPNGEVKPLKDERQYCSRKCANSHVQTEEQNEKRRIKLQKEKKVRDKKEKVLLPRISHGPYNFIRPPKDYPGKLYGKYTSEHHLVYWQHTGIVPKEGEVIHHINGDKKDNRFENLELQSMSDHSRNHAKKTVYIELTCDYCRELYTIPVRQYKYKIKKGQTLFFCCRQHLHLFLKNNNNKEDSDKVSNWA